VASARHRIYCVSVLTSPHSPTPHSPPRGTGAEPDTTPAGGERLRHVLVTAGGRTLRTTAAGYRFLLDNAHAQLWALVLRYVSALEARGLRRDETMAFLLRLSMMTPGQVGRSCAGVRAGK